MNSYANNSATHHAPTLEQIEKLCKALEGEKVTFSAKDMDDIDNVLYGNFDPVKRVEAKVITTKINKPKEQK